MTLSEMIAKLSDIQTRVGDVEVLITDGFACRCYNGDYEIVKYISEMGETFVDIGIGGCDEGAANDRL